MTRLLTSLITVLIAFISYRLYTTSTQDSLVIQRAMEQDSSIKGSKFEDAKVGTYVQKIQEVASADIPSLASEKTAWAMAWIHMVVWNSWKSTYFFADKYPKDDFANYRAYALMSIQFLVAHHDAEESGLFPTIDSKIPGAMKKNHEQHEAFLEPLNKLVEYLKTVTEDTFEPSVLRSQIDTILPPIMEHLAEELDSLQPSLLLTKFTQDEIASINTATHKDQQSKMGSASESLPFLLREPSSSRSPSLQLILPTENLPPSSPFPPAPGFVKNILGPYVFYWKYRTYWKYAAYPWKPTLPSPTL